MTVHKLFHCIDVVYDFSVAQGFHFLALNINMTMTKNITKTLSAKNKYIYIYILLNKVQRLQETSSKLVTLLKAIDDETELH